METAKVLLEHCALPAMVLISLVVVHVLLEITIKKFSKGMSASVQRGITICSEVAFWSSVALFVMWIVCLTILAAGKMWEDLSHHKFGLSKEKSLSTNFQ
jgi:hypothetical protein